jgi:uncharacterized protein YndB with AHSA1/START domain
MTVKPTGHYQQRADGLYLQFDRLFHAPIEDVWYSLTNPTAMKSWIGTYTGRPATGAVRFQMTEEGAEWINVTILECEAPHRFTADSGSGPAAMRVFCHLHEAGGMTTLTFGQLVKDDFDASSMGPGWDFYLDRLIAARRGAPLPAWESYYPAFRTYYADLTPPARTTSVGRGFERGGRGEPGRGPEDGFDPAHDADLRAPLRHDGRVAAPE